MKTCKDCGMVKPLGEFVPKASCKDGYEPRCRSCRTIKYNKGTPMAVARIIYGSQKTHSVGRGHPPPAYSFDELIQWMDVQPNAVAMWDAYVASNFKSWLKLSVDRLDDTKPYTLDNIQLTTWKENHLNGAKSKSKGIGMVLRPVAAFNLDGTHHKDYISIMDAVRDINGRMWGIVSVANGVPIKDGKGIMYQPKSYKGFSWEWIVN